MEDELSIGRIRTAHGVAGELKVESFSGETKHFEQLEAFTITKNGARQTRRVEQLRTYSEGLLIKLEGIDQREDAKKLAGWEIVVPRHAAAPCAEDEYYFADLIGLSVYCAGESRGIVETLWEGGAAPFLGVRLPGGAERLVPFQRAFVMRVDIANRIIEVADCEVLD